MNTEDVSTVSISEFLAYVVRHWIFGAVMVAVSLLLAFAYVQISPAQYEALANIIVLGDTQQQGVARDITLGNYIALITSNRVLEKVAEQTDLDIVSLRESMLATRDKANEIITINYTSGEADRAAAIIVHTIDSFQGAVSEMYGVPDGGVNILSPPVDSGKPVNKSFLTPMLMGLAGGVVLVLAIDFLRFDALKRKDSEPTGADEATEAEKRQQRKIARDAELVRKQELAAELQDIETRKAEAEARMQDAKLRAAQVNLSKVDVQVKKAGLELEKAQKKQRIAEADARAAKTRAEMIELELQSTLNNISSREAKEIALRDSLARRRAAKVESRITGRTDTKIIRIRAQKRIKAEKAAKVTVAAVEIPMENPEPLPYNQTLTEQNANGRRSGKTVGASAAQSFIKRPLGGGWK